MKKLLLLSLLPFLLITLSSCEKKDDGPTGSSIEFSLNPQLNQTYYFERWFLDSLNNKKEGPYYYYEKCFAKNLSIGGKNDAFLSVTYDNQTIFDSTFLRVENGKDIYEWMDTTGFIFDNANASIKNLLQKVKASYVWVPRILLSKGNGAEYTLLPKRVYDFNLDTLFRLKLSVEVVAKNEGFENVTVPAGTYKCYKAKILIKMEAFLPQSNQPLEKVDFVQYYWLSDDLDWWIKQYSPTVISRMFGVLQFGELHELKWAQLKSNF
ncbi:MAG: hypothetical protein N3F03_03020 [Ignavibacteria bacterium]|nr:hypothetical protein [Ignavibacteria bacterium]